MEADAVSSRPESPKKKVKSTPASDSEAQPSDYYESSSSSRSNDQPDSNPILMNGSQTRKSKSVSTPDSSSERTTRRRQEEDSTRIQEEVVSSSENSVSLPRKERSDVSASGDADSITNEPEDLTVCDSASAVLTEKH